MATTKTINLDLSYTDYDERTYKIAYQDDMTLERAVNAIQAFNTAAAIPNSQVAQTFLSKNGAPVARITSAMILQRDEEVIFNG